MPNPSTQQVSEKFKAQEEDYEQPYAGEFDEARQQLAIGACILDISRELGLTESAGSELAQAWLANTNGSTMDSLGNSAFALWEALIGDGVVDLEPSQELRPELQAELAPVVELAEYRMGKQTREEVTSAIEGMGGLSSGLSDDYLDDVAIALYPDEDYHDSPQYEEESVANWRLLIEYAAKGDERTAEKLIKSHRQFVVSRVRSLNIPKEDFEDAFQAGNIGLYLSIDRFDPLRGVPFVGFAIQYVDGYIKRHSRDTVSTIKIPRNLYELSPAVERTVELLRDENGEEPDNEDIAAYLDVDVDKVNEVRGKAHANRVSSYDSPVGNDGEGSLLNVFSEIASSNGLDELDLATLTIDLKEAIQTLDPRAREIVYLRFYEDLSQQMIADRIGISQVHISRLLRGAMIDLKKAMEKSVSSILNYQTDN